MTQDARVAVIGLDCVAPQLLFDDLAAETPNIHKLMANGMWGDLASITPPITVPAWACSMTGRTPGQLGIYGFRNRKDTSYEGLSIATADSVKEPAVWDFLGREGKKSVLLGVPPSYPPRPVEGWRVSCFLTPPSAKTWTYPLDLGVEIEQQLGGAGKYIFDIPNFREKGMGEVYEQLYPMTERRFDIARHLAKTKPWDFFMMVEMGADRLHHVFWQYYDPKHPNYEPNSPFESAFQDYYRFLDSQVGSLIETLPDDAVVIVMSDHGARRMDGGVCFNDWLIDNGYLTLSEPVDRITPITKAPIDWTRTLAWGDGGYYGRCFLNVKGREPRGVIEPARYHEIRDEIATKLESMSGPHGELFGTQVLKPEDVYPDVRGVAPDLIVYFADLEWRSVGTVGNPDVFTHENDTGPDGANHDRAAVFSMAGLPGQPTGRVEGLELVDVGPSILKVYGIDVPEDATGRSFL